uniref:Uncharacterized protein n=1 Tax=Petromyzon marinus TaxID=7757 RepID=S4RIN0_PETMA
DLRGASKLPPLTHFGLDLN